MDPSLQEMLHQIELEEQLWRESPEFEAKINLRLNEIADLEVADTAGARLSEHRASFSVG